MVLDPVANFGKVTVSIGYDAAATSIVLSSGDGARLPSTFSYNLTWWNATDYADPADDPNREIVRVTNRVSDTLTVTRGQEGTSASIKNVSGKTYKMVLAATKKTLDDVEARLLAGTPAQQFRAWGADKNGSDQSIAASTSTKLTFTNETFDTGGDYDSANSKFQPTVAGKYRVHARVMIGSLADQKEVQISLFKNGSVFRTFFLNTSGGTSHSVGIEAIIDLNGSTDYVEAYIFHNDTVSRSVSGNVNYTHFEGFRIQ